MSISVLNRHHLEKKWWRNEGYFYIGRGPTGSVLANPYEVREYGRDECIRLYRYEIHIIIKTKGEQSFRMDGPAAYAELVRFACLYRRGIPLHFVCSCKPLACHGDVLAKAVPYLASLLGLSVGDAVRHLDPDSEEFPWTGKIVSIDQDLSSCEVLWDSGVSLRRYPLTSLNKQDPQPS